MSYSLVILCIFITFDNLHFDKRLFISVATRYHTKILANFFWKFTIVTSVNTVWIIIKILSSANRWPSFFSTVWDSSIFLTHLEFSQISLNIFGYNSVKNIFRNVLQRLSECSSHLISNLSFQKTVKLFTLNQNDKNRSQLFYLLLFFIFYFLKVLRTFLRLWQLDP